MSRRELEAATRRDIRRAKRAGADAAFCVAMRQAVDDCACMYQHKLRGLPALEAAMRRERRAYYMTQFISRVDAISAVARAYITQIQAVRVRT